MTNQQESQAPTSVSAEEIEEVLIASAGAAPDLFQGRRGVPLEELGLDSLAVLELEAVLADRHGLRVPEGAVAMSVDEIVGHMSESAGAVG